MSTDDQRRASALTGEALLAARDESLQPLLDRLAGFADAATTSARKRLASSPASGSQHPAVTSGMN
jgi:hypothetical protein